MGSGGSYQESAKPMLSIAVCAWKPSCRSSLNPYGTQGNQMGRLWHPASGPPFGCDIYFCPKPYLSALTYTFRHVSVRRSFCSITFNIAGLGVEFCVLHPSWHPRGRGVMREREECVTYGLRQMYHYLVSQGYGGKTRTSISYDQSYIIF